MGIFWFLLENCCSQNTVCQKSLKKTCGRPAFLQKLQAPRIPYKVSLLYNKMPNSVRQVLQTYSDIYFLRATKNSLPEAVGENCCPSARESLMTIS